MLGRIWFEVMLFVDYLREFAALAFLAMTMYFAAIFWVAWNVVTKQELGAYPVVKFGLITSAAFILFLWVAQSRGEKLQKLQRIGGAR